MSDSEEKTIKPSARKMREATKRGQVAHFVDMFVALSLATGCLFLFLSFGGLVGFLRGQIEASLSVMSTATSQQITTLLEGGLSKTIEVVLALSGITSLVLLIAAIALRGSFIFSTYPLSPKLSNIDPIQGLKRIFGVRGMIELAKTLLKAAITLAFLFVVFRMGMRSFLEAARMGLEDLLSVGFWIVFILFFGLILIAILFALPDILIQRWIHQRDLKMTHSEMKQEQKDMFGSPEIRRARKRIQNEMARETTPLGIQNASVVIVGQSVAIGIRYVPAENQAPVTVAKVQPSGLETKLTIANLARVPFYSEPELAMNLMKEAPLGRPLPQKFYKDAVMALHGAGVLS